MAYKSVFESFSIKNLALPIFTLLFITISIDICLHRPPVENIKTFWGLPFIGTLLEHKTKDKSKYKIGKLLVPNFIKFYKWNVSQYSKGQYLNLPEHPILQFRIGKHWVVVVNSPELYKEIFIKNTKQINDRPQGESFHCIASNNVKTKTSIFTIGTTPFGSDYIIKKNYFQKDFLSNQHLEKDYLTVIEYECKVFLEQVQNKAVDALPFLQKFVVRIACWITFGVNLNEALDKKFYPEDVVEEIVFVEKEFINLRNPLVNMLDHMPRFIQLLFFKTQINKILEIKKRRESYITMLYSAAEEKFKTQNFKSDFEKKVFSNCLISKYLSQKDMQGDIKSYTKLNKAHILSICLTTMSAGLDNVSLLLNHLLHQIGKKSEETRDIQEILYTDIMRIYNQNKFEAKNKNSLTDYFEKQKFNFAYSATYLGNFGQCESVKNLLYETIRYLSVAPLGLPRLTSNNIVLSNKIELPVNTIVIANLFAINHNESVFEEPFSFNPNRFKRIKAYDDICSSNNKTVQPGFKNSWDLNQCKSVVFENIRCLPKVIQEQTQVSKETDRLLLLRSINGFGKGERSCLGKRLAETEMYFLLLHIIKIFNVSVVDNKNQPWNTTKAFTEELDPRINNSAFESIALEQKWDSFIYFKPRENEILPLQKREEDF